MTLDDRRWVDVTDRWPGRLRAAASLIHPGESVLDIGAGAEGLKARLDPSCPYTPADQHQRTPDTVIVDLEHPITVIGPFDVVALLGVLEYVADPLTALRNCRDLARHLVVSYAPRGSGSRGRNGWRNCMTRIEVEALFVQAGFVVESKLRWRDQFVYRLQRSGVTL